MKTYDELVDQLAEIVFRNCPSTVDRARMQLIAEDCAHRIRSGDIAGNAMEALERIAEYRKRTDIV